MKYKIINSGVLTSDKNYTNYTLENEQEQSRNENKQAANPDRVFASIPSTDSRHR
jgi:hypothetical protein